MNYKRLILATIAATSAVLLNSKRLKTTNINLSFKSLPSNFHNFKIAHVSDIHAKKVGFSDFYFLKELKNANPNIIVITGDMLDSYQNNIDTVYNILSQISNIAPTYFVSGNHELRLDDDYYKLKKILSKLNITNLNNTNTKLSIGNNHINLVGIEDYNYFKNDTHTQREDYLSMLNSLYSADSFNILLSHRPEKIRYYAEIGYDLVYSGHAHGGQWRVPFIGGIFSPSQGFFPKYTSGIYQDNNTNLVVSRGLGNSSFPIRINNRVELVVTTLKKGKN